MKKLTIVTLMLAAMFTACSKTEKKTPLTSNVILLQLGEDKGHMLAQEVTETFTKRLIEEDVVDASWNDITVFVKTLSAAKDTNFYSVRIVSQADKPATVVSLPRTRFYDLVSKECQNCMGVKVTHDEAAKTWTVSQPAKK